MWFSSWVWFKGLRSERLQPFHDRADMGVEIGLDASLDSRLPPLMHFAVNHLPAGTPTAIVPLGTDLRSSHRASE